MKVWTIATTGLVRMLKDRANIFFVFIFPLAIIFLVGAQFGSGGPAIEIAVSHDGGPVATAIVERIEAADVGVERLEDATAVADAVADGATGGGVVIPVGFDETLASGGTGEIGFASRPNQDGSLLPIVGGAVAEATADLRVARVVAAEGNLDPGAAREMVELVEVPGVAVTAETTGESPFPAGTGQFAVGASQQVVLFVFLTTLTGSAALIQSRQLGVTRRILSTPTSPNAVILGEGLSHFLVGLFQGVYIIGVTLVAFGVDWGDPLGAIAVLAALAATGAAAAMLVGALFSNDQQAGGISVMIGLGLAAIGGCMLPLELFSPTMNRIAHFTPHAWAVDGFADLVYRDGSVADVLPEVGVLLGFALVLALAAGWRLREVIARP